MWEVAYDKTMLLKRHSIRKVGSINQYRRKHTSTSHIWRFPFVAAAQISFPSGLKATARTSQPCSIVSMQSFLYTSHSLTVPSQEPVRDGEKERRNESGESFSTGICDKFFSEEGKAIGVEGDIGKSSHKWISADGQGTIVEESEKGRKKRRIDRKNVEDNETL